MLKITQKRLCLQSKWEYLDGLTLAAHAVATVQTLNIRVLFRHLTNYGK